MTYQWKRSLSYSIKLYLFLALGMVIMAFGVAFAIEAALGTSPISSLPYVVNLLSPLSVGTATIAMHCCFILIQILILRKQFQPAQLMQLPVAFFFGYLTDFAIWVVEKISCEGYLMQWVFCAIGIVLVAVGVSFEVTAHVVVLAGEGVVLAVCRVCPIKFGTMKVIFDVSLVVLAAALSLIFLHRLEGIREGTVAAALLVGTISRQLNKPLGKLGEKILN